MIEHICRGCGVTLSAGENITQCSIDHSKYLCRTCVNDYNRDHRQKHSERARTVERDRRHNNGTNLPMSENRYCASFLGVHVAERVLSHVFHTVQKMPYGNNGFDFLCRHGYKVDVKSSCRRRSEPFADSWTFSINNNHIADYFLLLAFDNREHLEPEHIWLIPGRDINNRTGVGIAETRIGKWAQYEQPLDMVRICCDGLKGD